MMTPLKKVSVGSTHQGVTAIERTRQRDCARDKFETRALTIDALDERVLFLIFLFCYFRRIRVSALRAVAGSAPGTT